MIQTNKQPTWIDSASVAVPYSRTTALERKKENTAAKLLKQANQINSLLQVFKVDIEDACKAFYNEVLKQNNADKRERKGNFTWFNFDKTIRIEVNATERVEFKQPEIGLAKEKLDDFIKESLNTSDSFIHEIVNSAFENTKGGLDPKKVLSLLRYRSKTKAVKFHEALDLIEKSIDRNASKTYYRIAVKNESNGEYEYIKLNFSDI